MSKKSKLMYMGIGGAIMFVVLILVGIYIVIIENPGPFLTMKNNGMSPAILDGESVRYDETYSFDLVTVDDVIIFRPDELSEKLVIQRVVEIIQENPKEIKTLPDSISDSVYNEFYVSEHEFLGKAIKVFPANEDSIYLFDGRDP